jgi:peptide deformylase
MFVYEFGSEKGVVINPVIEDKSKEEIEEEEGCLSYPLCKFKVKRNTSIKISFFDLAGDKKEKVCVGALAKIFQHEIDHLNGVLLFDRIDDRNERQEAMLSADRLLVLGSDSMVTGPKEETLFS